MDDLLLGLLKALLGSAISAGTGPVFDKVLSALGINTNQTQAEILQALQQLSAELSEVISALGALENQVTQVQEQITEQSYQQALETMYEPAKNTIVTNYSSLVAAMSNLNNASLSVQQQAVADVQSLLSITNANAVAEAMLSINSFVAGDSSVQFLGFAPLQIGLIQDAIYNYWQSTSNLGNLHDPNLDPPRAAWVYEKNIKYSQMPNPNNVSYQIAGEYWTDSFRILTQTPSDVLAPTFQQTVIPDLTAVLNVQAQGLLFLYMAWNGGPQQSEYTAYSNNINSQFTAMQSLFTYFETANQAYDAFLYGVLVQFGPQPTTATLGAMYAYFEVPAKWPEGSGWTWVNASPLPGATSPYAVIRFQSSLGSSQNIVYFTKAAQWQSSNTAPYYVNDVVLGWHFSKIESVTIPSTLYGSSYSGAALNPIMNSFLGWWLTLNNG